MRENLVTGPLSHEVIIENDDLPQLSRQVSNYEAMVQLLDSMGFDHKKIELAISLSNARSIEETFPFLIKGERGWEHSYTRTL